MKRLVLASVMTVLAAGCSAASEKPAEESAATVETAMEAAPAPAMAPAPAPASTAPTAQTSGAPALSAYERKYPNEAVGGVAFVNHPAVRAIVAASGAPSDVSELMALDDQVVTPIRRAGRRLIASGYDPRGAGADAWSILISDDGSKGAVCTRNADGGADWYIEGQKAFTLDAVCPSKPDEIEGLGDWPIGAIPS